MSHRQQHATEEEVPETAQSHQELLKRVYHLKTLHDVGQGLGTLRDPEPIMQHWLLMTLGAFGGVRGGVWLYDTAQQKLLAVAQRGLASTVIADIAHLLRSAAVPDIDQVVDVPRHLREAPRDALDALFLEALSAARLHLWIPFAINKRVRGGIGLGARLSGEQYAPDEQEFCRTLANQLTVALDNALAYQEIRELNSSLEAKVQERTAELHRQQEQLRAANTQLELRNQFIHQVFGRYVSAEVVANLLASPEKLQLGGEKRYVTLLIADLRGFSAVAERLSPEQVVHMVNRYLGTMVDVIAEYQGTINEFIGDAILVLFGAPVWLPEHAPRAVACALAMQLAMASVNAANTTEGLPEVEMGIGIHTGEVVVGNIGSHKRTKYGVVGRHVNLTSRIESYTVGGQVLISDTTRHEVGPIVTIAQHFVMDAKGLAEPITLYDVRGMAGEYQLVLPEYEDDFAPLPQPFPVRYTVLTEKHLGNTVHTGACTALSAKGGNIQCDLPLELWSNLKLWLGDEPSSAAVGALYGKVVRIVSGYADQYAVRFTAVPADIEDVVQRLVG